MIYILIGFTFSLSETRTWDSHSAYLMPKKRWEIGLFQPFRYALSDNIEYSIHPLWFSVIPNIAFKGAQHNVTGYKTAAQLKLFYPTPMLNILARRGIGGLIDPNITMPPMLGISGTGIASRKIFGLSTTFNVGLDLGITAGKLDRRSSIDLPLVYHRLGVFYNGWGLHTGVDLQAKLTDRVKLHLDIDLRLLPGISKDHPQNFFTILSGENVLEHKLLLIWNRSQSFRVLTGYKLVTGQYPYGHDIRLLPYIPLLETWIPIVELQWAKK